MVCWSKANGSSGNGRVPPPLLPLFLASTDGLRARGWLLVLGRFAFGLRDDELRRALVTALEVTAWVAAYKRRME